MNRIIGKVAGVGAAVAFVLASSAHADLLGIQFVNKTVALGGDPQEVVAWELYAVFSEADDRVTSVYHVNAEASGDFIHIEPLDENENPSLPLRKSTYDAAGSVLDSFVTVGFVYKGGAGNPDGPDANRTGDVNACALDPDFCEPFFVESNLIGECDATEGGGWWVNAGATSIQGMAGSYPDLKVLLGRFVLPNPAVGCPTMDVTLSLTYKSGGSTFQAVNLAASAGCILLPDCNGNGTSDVFEIAENPALDCNNNLELDSCEAEHPLGDLNGDNHVDGADLGVLLAEWGQSTCEADLDHDGVVGGSDLGVLLANWAP